MDDGAMSDRWLRVIQRWDGRLQQRADRREARRSKSPRRTREVTTPDGKRFTVVAHERGFPEPQRRLTEALFLWPLPLVDDLMMVVDIKRWLAFRWRHRRAWLVRIKGFDDRGYPVKPIQTVVVESRDAAMTAVADITDMLRNTGEKALAESIARGKYRAA
jgi:hypothetical protein